MDWENLKVTVDKKASFIYFIYPFLFESNICTGTNAAFFQSFC